MSDWRRLAMSGGDLALAGAFAALMQLEIWVFGDLTSDLAGQVLASAVSPVAAGAIAFRRTHPFPAFAVNLLAVYVLIGFTGPSDFYQYTELVMLYSVAAHGRSRLTWLALPVSLPGAALYFVRFPSEGDAPTITMALLIWIVAWLMGMLTKSAVDRQRLEVERDYSVELADVRQRGLELEEARTTMARELHDIIGHTLNVMLVHAGAARRALPGNVAQATEAISIIETTGRSAMDDLDRVLGLLRADGDSPLRDPLPGLDDLGSLAASVSDTDLQVDVKVTASAASVPRPVQLTVYRIAQEALTNVIKHAGASVVTVDVSCDGPDLALEVRDNGRGVGRGAQPGRGLTGMQQRAALHGGTLTTSERPEGGTVLCCRIPVRP